MKRKRHNAILSMVSEGSVRTQEDLLEELRRHGFDVTQATISRDLRELGLVKTPAPDGGYHYALSETHTSPGARLSAVLRDAVNSCDCAQNLVVIKTIPGLAPAVCSAVDAMSRSGVVGTLAGDDTGLAICRDTQEAERLRDDILSLIR